MVSIARDEHRPVLLEEVLERLRVQEDGIYIDCTFGRGGHTGAILSRLGGKGRLLAMDRDPAAVVAAHVLLTQDSRFTIERGSFSMLESFANRAGVAGKVNGVLFDLGVASPQLESPARGFSFLQDGPLNMRMDPDSGIGAAEWLATADQNEIAEVLWRYGEERHAQRIARAIVKAHRIAPITTTGRLAEIITHACPRRGRGIHPATRSFQAIRIFINKELDELSLTLPQAARILARGGRLLVISFHSLEDRIVKRFMRKEALGNDYPSEVPVPAAKLHPTLRLVSRAIRASAGEIAENPRARSAVLRVAEKVA